MDEREKLKRHERVLEEMIRCILTKMAQEEWEREADKAVARENYLRRVMRSMPGLDH